MGLYDKFSNLHVVLKVRELIRRRWGLEMFYIDEEGIVKGFSEGEIYQPKNLVCKSALGKTNTLKHCIAALREVAEKGHKSGKMLPFVHKVCQVGFVHTGVPIFFDETYWGCVCVSGIIDTPLLKKQRDAIKKKALEEKIKLRNWDKALDSIQPLNKQDFEYIGQLMTMAVEEMITVERELSKRELQILKLKNNLRTRYHYDAIIGKSAAMQDLFQLLDKVSDTNANIFIQGESGTGKELVAKAIHYNSRRNSKDFVVANCSAFNDNLLESELFGHVKGSFTGAIRDKRGLFEIAHGGSFFMDEIGEMSPAMQVKLLRILQEGTFTRVGGVEEKKVNVRFITATHRDLKEMITLGSFREDLYYRVNVINIVLPPLRDRREDLPLLTKHFLKKHLGPERAKKITVSDQIMEAFYNYPWPGNIRELENEVERLLVLSGNTTEITEEALSPHIAASIGSRGSVLLPEAKPVLREAPVATPAESIETNDPKAMASQYRYYGKMKDAVEAVEKELIAEGLRRTGGNKSKVAKELGISRTNLILKVDKYELDKKEA